MFKKYSVTLSKSIQQPPAELLPALLPDIACAMKEIGEIHLIMAGVSKELAWYQRFFSKVLLKDFLYGHKLPERTKRYTVFMEVYCRKLVVRLSFFNDEGEELGPRHPVLYYSNGKLVSIEYHA